MATIHEYALERTQREYGRLALQGEILKALEFGVDQQLILAWARKE